MCFFFAGERAFAVDAIKGFSMEELQRILDQQVEKKTTELKASFEKTKGYLQRSQATIARLQQKVKVLNAQLNKKHDELFAANLQTNQAKCAADKLRRKLQTLQKKKKSPESDDAFLQAVDAAAKPFVEDARRQQKVADALRKDLKASRERVHRLQSELDEYAEDDEQRDQDYDRRRKELAAVSDMTKLLVGFAPPINADTTDSDYDKLLDVLTKNLQGVKNSLTVLWLHIGKALKMLARAANVPPVVLEPKEEFHKKTPSHQIVNLQGVVAEQLTQMVLKVAERGGGGSSCTSSCKGN